MRVIGGQAKGRRLKSLKGRSLRPTAARVKEALFNILPHDLGGYRILDLFAGIGNLSLEAMSRGGSEAVLVDSSRAATKAIKENLQALGFADRSKVWTTPVLQSIRLLSSKEETFDIIFVDPPYEKNLVERTVKAIAQAGLMREEGVLVVEHSVREKLESGYGPLALRDQRRYGTSVLSFFVYDRSKTSDKERGTTWHEPT
jgi:16S rRNA (guanine966-N2)-methyltransferase